MTLLRVGARDTPNSEIVTTRNVSTRVLPEVIQHTSGDSRHARCMALQALGESGEGGT